MLSFSACKVKKGSEKKPKAKKENKQVEAVLKKALSFDGTKYKYGGTGKSGMDCSGLVYVSFQEAGIELPHSSFEQSKMGKAVSRKELRKGDLLFFATGNDKNKISHVGIVLEILKDGDIEFIHASTQRGVCRDKLSQDYYKQHYRFARRVL